MYDDRDLLEDLAFLPHLTTKMIAERRADFRTTLAQLNSLLDSPPPKPINWSSVSRDFWLAVPLLQADLPGFMDLYRRVYEVGGSGTNYMQRTLLRLIAVTILPETVLFWLDIIDWTRPRDSFTKHRRHFAVSALSGWPRPISNPPMMRCARRYTTPIPLCAPRHCLI